MLVQHLIFSLQSSYLDASRKYDYIIAGMGCAGLSLAVHMIVSEQFRNKKILLIDKEDKQQNDRTWCFWQRDSDFSDMFDPIVLKQWNNAWFHSKDFSRLLDLSPFAYKLIRGIDFYNYCLSIIRAHPNFEIQRGTIQGLENENGSAWAEIDNEKVYSDYIFNSILFKKSVMKKGEYYLLQHFKGWIIETEKPVFDPERATLMDFRVNQEQGTTFVYVMPFLTTKALVEYTLFSEKLLEPVKYNEGLKNYIDKFLNAGDYRVVEEEFGVIPMTNHKYPAVNGRIVNIGAAGGQTKASSGYTFRFIQKHSARIVNSLIKKNNPFISNTDGPKRFKFYDSTLLHILANNKLPGDKIFTRLFKKNKPQQVLRFLDNESTLGDELKIISSLPTLPFLKAALKQI